jgi:hypothetical protein
MESVGRTPLDLAAFLRALELAAERADSVDRDSLAVIELAWTIPDTVVSSFGWVITLKDGRRLYLEYTLSDVAGVPEELAIAPLAAGQHYPVLEDAAGVVWYQPDHINDHLGLSGPRRH